MELLANLRHKMGRLGGTQQLPRIMGKTFVCLHKPKSSQAENGTGMYLRRSIVSFEQNVCVSDGLLGSERSG